MMTRDFRTPRQRSSCVCPDCAPAQEAVTGEASTRQGAALAAYDVLYQSLHRDGTREEIVVRGNDVHALLFLCDLGLLSVGINPDTGRVEG